MNACWVNTRFCTVIAPQNFVPCWNPSWNADTRSKALPCAAWSLGEVPTGSRNVISAPSAESSASWPMSNDFDFPSLTHFVNDPAKQSAIASVRIVGYLPGFARSASGVMPIRFCAACPISCASTITTAASPNLLCNTGNNAARS